MSTAVALPLSLGGVSWCLRDFASFQSNEHNGCRPSRQARAVVGKCTVKGNSTAAR